MFRKYQERIIDSLMFFVPFVLFCAFNIKSFTGDALSYVSAIRAGSLYHPHHLLFNAAGFLFYKVLTYFGYKGELLFSTQMMNIIFGSLTIYVVHIYLKNILRDKTLAVAFSCLILFSYAFWLNTCNPEVYISTMLFLSVSLIILDKIIKNPKISLFFIVSITTALAMFLHQTSIFFFFFAILFVLLSDIHYKKKLIFIGIFSIVTATIVISVYWTVAVKALGVQNIHDFNYWITSYAHTGIWGKWDGLNNVKSAVKSLSHVFLGGGGEEMFLKAILRKQITFRNMYLLICLTGMVSYASLYLMLFIKNLRNITIIDLKSIFIPFLFWIAVYGSFFIWWDPGNSEFAFFLLLPIIFMISYSIKILKIKKSFKMLHLIIFLTLIFIFNFFGFILPEAIIPNQEMQMAQYFMTNTSENNLVVTIGISDWRENAYFDYFVHNKVKIFPLSIEIKNEHNDYLLVISKLKQLIDNQIKEGKRIFIDARIFYPSEANIGDFKMYHPSFVFGDMLTFFDNYKLSLVAELKGKAVLYKINGYNKVENKKRV